MAGVPPRRLCWHRQIKFGADRLKLLIMSLLTPHLTGIKWRINQEDPVTSSIKYLPGWQFINPLLHFQLLYKFGPQLGLAFYAHLGQDVVIRSPYLLFEVPENFSLTDSEYDFRGQIRLFLSNLRRSSKQYDLSIGKTKIESMWLMEISSFPELKFPSASQVKVLVRKEWVDFAITWNHLKMASQKELISEIYDDVFLDALDAFASDDYRRAILYSAMSIEIIAATKLDEAYEKALEQDNNTDIRIISINQIGGKKIVKDPIYEHLSNRASFSLLLHERPLYLFNRSLLVENEKLYKTALKLYKTRNKIVHLGELIGGKNASHFEMNQEDTKDALNCAIEIFKWFGESDKYIIPDSSLIEAKGSEVNFPIS